MYLSPTGEEEWGPDQLDDLTIPAGEEFILTDIPSGYYDFLVVGCEGSELITQLDIEN